MARFHDYDIQVSQEQMKTLRPLGTETPTEFILRWLDIRMHCPQPSSEKQMVQECIEAAQLTYLQANTFYELQKQVEVKGQSSLSMTRVTW